MDTMTGLMVVVSSQGFWFGGETGSLTLRWAAEAALAPTVIQWELKMNEVRLSQGDLALDAAQGPSTLTLRLPPVRTRVEMTWSYRVRAREGGREIGRGRETIHAFPRNLLEPVGDRLALRRVLVCDVAGGLPAILDGARVKYERIDTLSEARLATVNMIVVGPGRVGASPFEDAVLVEQARAGAGVLVFVQNELRSLAGYEVVRRPADSKLQWRGAHPLLLGLREADLQSCLKGAQGDLRPLRLPRDEPALEIGWWPREVDGEQPVPIDALLVVRSVGKGRLVLCQIPLGPWQSDPRSQLLLANALTYMTTAPEATPRPSQRRMAPERPLTSMPTITIPPGANP